MSDLREQLLKAGLVSEGQVRKAARSAGAKGHEARKKGPRRGAQAAPRAEPGGQGPAQARTLKRMLQSFRLAGNTRGTRRWYWERRDGTIPYLEINEAVAAKLEQGLAAIAEDDEGRSCLIDAEGARKLEEAAPEWVRCFQVSRSAPR